jgi:hypothetical protein
MCLQNVECPIDPFVNEDHEWCECHDCGASIYMGQYSDFVDAEYWPEKKDNTWVQLCIKDVKYSEKMLKDRYTQEWIIQKEVKRNRRKLSGNRNLKEKNKYYIYII